MYPSVSSLAECVYTTHASVSQDQSITKNTRGVLFFPSRLNFFSHNFTHTPLPAVHSSTPGVLGQILSTPTVYLPPRRSLPFQSQRPAFKDHDQFAKLQSRSLLCPPSQTYFYLVLLSAGRELLFRFPRCDTK